MALAAYYMAVVPDRLGPEHCPFVSTPVGPYRLSEPEDRHESAKAWLRDVYGSEDIRRVIGFADPDDARIQVMHDVQWEHREARLKREAECALAALAKLGPEKFGGEAGLREWREAMTVTIRVDAREALEQLEMVRSTLDVVHEPNV